MSGQTGLPQRDIDVILKAYRGMPTVIMGAIVMPDFSESDSPAALRIITVEEACQIIRDLTPSIKHSISNSLGLVLQMGNAYTQFL